MYEADNAGHDLQSGFFFDTPDGKDTILRGVPGALALHGTKKINVTNCTFEHLGLTGLLADDGAQDIYVTHSKFRDVSGSAIALGNVTKSILTKDEEDGKATKLNSDGTSCSRGCGCYFPCVNFHQSKC